MKSSTSVPVSRAAAAPKGSCAPTARPARPDGRSQKFAFNIRGRPLGPSLIPGNHRHIGSNPPPFLPCLHFTNPAAQKYLDDFAGSTGNGPKVQRSAVRRCFQRADKWKYAR
jgi:hypothetical protein